MISERRSVDILAAVGVAFGAIFGLAGTVVTQPSLRQLFWAIDGVGLIVACSLLTIRFFRLGHECVAAGFLVFAIGESHLVAGTAAGLEASVPSFAGGIALWAAGLLLTSIPRVFSNWVRIAGVLAAILFAMIATRIFLGEKILPTASPFPFFAYPFLVLTFIGWIVAVLKGRITS